MKAPVNLFAKPFSKSINYINFKYEALSVTCFNFKESLGKHLKIALKEGASAHCHSDQSPNMSVKVKGTRNF